MRLDFVPGRRLARVRSSGSQWMRAEVPGQLHSKKLRELLHITSGKTLFAGHDPPVVLVAKFQRRQASRPRISKDRLQVRPWKYLSVALSQATAEVDVVRVNDGPSLSDFTPSQTSRRRRVAFARRAPFTNGEFGADSL